MSKHPKTPDQLPPEIQDWRQRAPLDRRNFRDIIRKDAERLRRARDAARTDITRNDED